MANTLNTPCKRIAWLAALLACLLLPVLAVAHSHDADPLEDSVGAAEHCIVCQVVSGKTGPVPRGPLTLEPFRTTLVFILTVTDHRGPGFHADPTVLARGPPAV